MGCSGTQAEVDELQSQIDVLQDETYDIWKALNDRYVQMEVGNDNLYYHCSISDTNTKICESVNYQEQIDELREPLQETVYSQEQVNMIVDLLLKEIVEIKYTNDLLDVSYEETTQTFTITQYNQYGTIIDVDVITVDELIELILRGV